MSYHKTYTNTEEGMRSHITIGNMGYHVSLEDTDSGNFLPTVKGFTDFEDAENYAIKLVNLKNTEVEYETY